MSEDYDSDYNVRPEAGRKRPSPFVDSEDELGPKIVPEVKHRPLIPRDSDTELDASSPSSRPPTLPAGGPSTTALIIRPPRAFDWKESEATEPPPSMPPPPLTKTGRPKPNFRIPGYVNQPDMNTVGDGMPEGLSHVGPYKSLFRAETGQPPSPRSSVPPEARKPKPKRRTVTPGERHASGTSVPGNAEAGPSTAPAPRPHSPDIPPPVVPSPVPSPLSHRTRRPSPLRSRESARSSTPSYGGHGDGLFTPQSSIHDLSPTQSSTRELSPLRSVRSGSHQRSSYSQSQPSSRLNSYDSGPFSEMSPTTNDKGKSREEPAKRTSSPVHQPEHDHAQYPRDVHEHHRRTSIASHVSHNQGSGRKLMEFPRDPSWDEQKPALSHCSPREEKPRTSSHHNPHPTPAPAPRPQPVSQRKARQPSPTPSASTSVRPPAAQKLRTLTVLIEDRRTGVDELAEVKVHLKAGEDPDMGSCFWTDAKDVCEKLQNGPSRIDGPAKVYTMRGKYRQTILRITADGVETSQSAFLQVRKDKTLTVFVDSINVPMPQLPPTQSFPTIDKRSVTPYANLQPLTPMSEHHSLHSSPAPSQRRHMDRIEGSPPKRKRAPSGHWDDRPTPEASSVPPIHRRTHSKKNEELYSPTSSVVEIPPAAYHSALESSPQKKMRRERETRQEERPSKKSPFDSPPVDPMPARQPSPPRHQRREERQVYETSMPTPASTVASPPAPNSRAGSVVPDPTPRGRRKAQAHADAAAPSPAPAPASAPPPAHVARVPSPALVPPPAPALPPIPEQPQESEPMDESDDEKEVEYGPEMDNIISDYIHTYIVREKEWDYFRHLKGKTATLGNFELTKVYWFAYFSVNKYALERVPARVQYAAGLKTYVRHVLAAMEVDKTWYAACFETLSLVRLYGQKGGAREDQDAIDAVEHNEPKVEPVEDEPTELLDILREIHADYCYKQTEAGEQAAEGAAAQAA